MTDTPEPDMTDAEYQAMLESEIDEISDRDVRAALVNHALILRSFDRILTTLADRQLTVERIIVTMVGGALAPKPETPTVPGVEHRPGAYL